MNTHLNNRPILHDQGDGLILCRSTTGDETRVRLNTLFPKKTSSVMRVN